MWLLYTPHGIQVPSMMAVFRELSVIKYAGRMIHIVTIATQTIRFLILSYNNNNDNNTTIIVIMIIIVMFVRRQS